MIPLLLVLMRIYCLKNKRTILLVLITMIIMVGRCLIITNDARRQTVKKEHEIVQTILVNPDMLKINGNLVTTIAKTTGGEKYLCSMTVLKQSQLQELHNATKPLKINIRGNIQPIAPATNENQFNPQQFYRSQGIFNSIRGQVGDLQAMETTYGSFLHSQRAKLIHYFCTLPAPCNYYCNRLLLGYSDIELIDIIRAVQKLGIVHLFCLSGLHVTVLCTIVRKMLSFLNMTREKINIIQLFTLPIFLVIGGQSISLTRAIIMLELGIIFRMVGIKSCDSWSLGLLIHTLIVPGVLLNLGGQLSYLLSFALCRFKWQTVWQQTTDLNIVGLPVLLNTTYQFHCLTTLLNYVMIPIFSWIMLPMILICAIFGSIFPWIVKICNQGLIWYQKLIQLLSNAPGLVIYGKLPGWCSLVLVISTLIWCEHSFAPQKMRNMIITSYIAIFLWIHFPCQGEVTFFDIGQGDSILIREPFNQTISLIDTGGQLHFKTPAWQRRTPTTDGAQKISINYLKSKGITTIDTVLLSHSDADHIGFLTTVCQEMKVKSIVVPSGMERLSKFTKRISTNTKVIPVTDKVMVNNVPLKILHPFQKGHGKNEDSLVLYGKFGSKSFIFTGDLDRHGEKQVLVHYPALTADVVKLGHHGSKTSSDPQFIKQLAPQLAIISAGRHNRYGHPNQETLSTLKRQGTLSWSTQRYGMINYYYGQNYGHFKTKLRGDEFNWMH